MNRQWPRRIYVGTEKGNTFVTLDREFLEREGVGAEMLDIQGRLIISTDDFSKLMHNYYAMKKEVNS